MQREMNKYKLHQTGYALMINKYQDRYKLCTLIKSFLGILGMALCSMEQEIYLAKGTDKNYEIRYAILLFNLISTLILIVTIIFSYYLWVDVQRINGRMLTIDSMPKDVIIELLLEILLNIIMPYPFTMKSTFKEKIYLTNYYAQKRVDTVLLSLMYFFRVYHLFYFRMSISYFMSNKAYRICNIYGVNCTQNYAFKCIFKNHSLTISLLIYLGVCLLFGALYRFNGMPSKLQFSDLQNFTWGNSMWCAFITMTSVGYGDFYPKSEFGRIVGVLCALVGAFIQSLFTISFLQILNFDKFENFSYRLITGVRKRLKLAKRAAIMIIFNYRFNKSRSKSYLSKYSYAKTKFMRTSYHVRLEFIKGITKDEENVMRTKSICKNIRDCVNIVKYLAENKEDLDNLKRKSKANHGEYKMIPSKIVREEMGTNLFSGTGDVSD